MQDLIDQGRLPGSRCSRYTDELPQRNIDIKVLEIVLSRALDFQPLAADRSSRCRGGDRALSREILTGRGSLALHDVAQLSFTHNRAAVDAGAWSHLDHVVGRPDGVLIVLHHHYRIAQISQGGVDPL